MVLSRIKFHACTPSSFVRVKTHTHTQLLFVAYFLRVQPAVRGVKFCGFEWQTYELHFGITDVRKKVFTIFSNEHCFEACLYIETVWITNCVWPTKYSRSLKLTRLQKRLHSLDIDHCRLASSSTRIGINTFLRNTYSDQLFSSRLYYVGLKQWFVLVDSNNIFRNVLLH